MGDFVVGESRAAGSRVNGVEGGVPEEGDRVAFEWMFDEGELFHECLARATREGHLPNRQNKRGKMPNSKT